MSDIIDINVTKIEETIDIVANFQHPNIDITTIENIDNIEINATPNVVQININSISGDVEWGEIGGTLSNQTDLQNVLDLKANSSDLGAVAFSNDYNDLDNLPNIPSIDNLVPYVGATQNVDLGEHQIKAGQVEFDTTPTGNAGVGILRWNDSDGTLDLGLKGGNVTLQIGQEQLVRVVNKTGSNLLESNYQAVRVNGAQGQRLKVDLAQATNDLLSAETIGLVTENIDNNQEGFVTTSGLIRGINTTGSLQGETWADGDMLYLSPSVAGKITNIKPSAPNHLVVVGYVVYAHANNGSIFVKVDNGYELEELHNVTETNYTTLIDTDSVLTFDVNNSLWKRLSWANVKSNLKTYFDTIYQTALGFTPENVSNKATNLTSPDNTKYPTTLAVSTALSGKQDTLTNPITGTGTNGQVAFFNGTTTQTSDNVFVWDNTNKRLGIGTNTPSTSLDVLGALTLRKTSENEQTILTINRFNSVPMFKLHISGVDDNQLFLRNDYNQNIITFQRAGAVIVQGSLYSNTELGIGRSIGDYLSKFLSTDAYGSFYELQTNIEGVGWGSLLQWNRNRTYFNILSNNVGIGTTSPSARLDIKAQGALSTDIAFRVRNSVDTANLLQVNGQGTLSLGLQSSAPTGIEGAIYYNSTDKKHYGFNGTTWNAFY